MRTAAACNSASTSAASEPPDAAVDADGDANAAWLAGLVPGAAGGGDLRCGDPCWWRALRFMDMKRGSDGRPVVHLSTRPGESSAASTYEQVGWRPRDGELVGWRGPGMVSSWDGGPGMVSSWDGVAQGW